MSGSEGSGQPEQQQPPLEALEGWGQQAMQQLEFEKPPLGSEQGGQQPGSSEEARQQPGDSHEEEQQQPPEQQPGAEQEQTWEEGAGEKDEEDEEVEGLLLVTARTALWGRFPLNGTYFQASLCPDTSLCPGTMQVAAASCPCLPDTSCPLSSCCLFRDGHPSG